MAAPVGPKKVHRYSNEFKIQAVKLSLHPEIQTQDVAHALDIHPFMLSKWKKDYREGKLKPAANAAGLSLPGVLRSPVQDLEKRELKRQVDLVGGQEVTQQARHLARDGVEVQRHVARLLVAEQLAQQTEIARLFQ